MSTTCLLKVLGTVLDAEYSVCSRGYVAQDFFVCVCAKKNRRMKDSVLFSLSNFTTWMALCAPNCGKIHDPDKHDSVFTHLEPNILECEAKWALESITMNKASGGDGFQLSYFKS